MSVFRCRECHETVQWMNTKFAKRMLFDALPIETALDVENQGWIPGTWRVGGGNRTVMAPIGHYGREKISRVRHVVLLHACSSRLESA
jgi:hypothetical protein